MKKIIITFISLLFVILSIAQSDLYWGSYTYPTQKDTMKFNSWRSDQHLVFHTISGDSAVHVGDGVTIALPDSGYDNILLGTGFFGFPNKIIFNHNDVYSMYYLARGGYEVDLTQLQTLTYLKIVGNYGEIDLTKNQVLEELELDEFNPGGSGTIDLSNNQNLSVLKITNSGSAISFVDLANNNKLTSVILYNNNISSITLGVPNQGCSFFNLNNNSAPQSQVDKILKWLVDGNGINGTVDLSNNSCPSATGFSNAAILAQRGWLVFVEKCTTNTPPTVETIQPTYISKYSAMCGGNIMSQGSSSVSARGVCWNTTGSPTTANNITTDGSGVGKYSSSLAGLSANTTYYVRAYATNSSGTAYGSEYSFTTLLQVSVPALTTNIITEISSNTATSGGHIISDGGDQIVEKGVCWNTSGSPTYSESKTADGSGNADFTSSITGLSENTTYYVRAYARNRTLVGDFYVYALGYGQEEIFTTTGGGTLPTVDTYSINTITSNSAYSGGNVTDDGDSEVILKGICWNTSGMPTTANDKTTNGSGLGSFISYINGLSCGMTYFIRAYATNSSGTAYGNSINFSTGMCTYIPTVVLNTITKYGDTYATFSGSVTSDGNSTITERGFVYSTLPNPTTSNSKITAGTGTGLFTANAYGLISNTKYYVRAYAINSIGTAYSDQLDFTTLTSASAVSISTSIPIDITTSTATLGGNISSDGGYAITERGVVYGTSVNPTTSNTKIQSGTGTGIYTASATGLTQGTTYHVRAYAINSSGTFYGQDEIFITLIDGATACNAGQSFPGGQSYPSTNTIVLGSGTGNVTLTFEAYTRPDFFLVEYNSTFYNSGWRGSYAYDYGGTLRNDFKSALLGKVDPSQNTPFPPTFPNIILYPEDGYPRVNSSSGNISFVKSTNNPTTAKVKVYAPIDDTYWSYILSCPE